MRRRKKGGQWPLFSFPQVIYRPATIDEMMPVAMPISR